ncbi:hypothetical protein ABEF92_002169 [Exophiala dermatitidis]|uniref:Exosome complex subunit Csl4 n=1 Tax=Exophiala dermatitidis (strain ATCC 34100 / CBS 525.76 / NIH/UT8656) TaxID=858893 RepID=H6BNL1_EXODN|nr:exosome complex subunit Csl4 [Exophiala dermatitidis NIH/UT8656]EHY53196.1 exosome complex subunit Csl4 [Exophiala dermatitidis NIH/UT8656]
MASASTSTFVVPGQVLGNTSSHVPGPGTHVYENNIVASIIGRPVVLSSPAAADTSAKTKTNNTSTSTNKPIISVPHSGTAGEGVTPTPTNTITTSSTIGGSGGSTNTTLLPKVGSTVLVRITRVQQRQISASILVVDPSPNDITSYTRVTDDDLQFQAVLRREDIRTHEKDKIVMNDMYRVGDIVRAMVISLGDERNYYISTAGNEFGVVVATSDAGNAMVPASWREMRDVVTGQAESRKVAKPS